MIAWLAYQISYWYLNPFMSYRGFKRWKSDTYTRTHTHTHTHTSGRQLKITFLDVSDYSEYSDTNISKKKFLSKNVTLRIFDVFIPIFHIIHKNFSGEWTNSCTVSLNFFQKRYFEKRKKNSYGFWKINKFIWNKKRIGHLIIFF